MNWTQKETSLLKDLKSQEQLCVEKYGEYAARANDPELRGLFEEIRRNEQQRALAGSCGATFVRTACYYPGLNYD